MMRGGRCVFADVTNKQQAEDVLLETSRGLKANSSTPCGQASAGARNAGVGSLKAPIIGGCGSARGRYSPLGDARMAATAPAKSAQLQASYPTRRRQASHPAVRHQASASRSASGVAPSPLKAVPVGPAAVVATPCIAAPPKVQLKQLMQGAAAAHCLERGTPRGMLREVLQDGCAVQIAGSDFCGNQQGPQVAKEVSEKCTAMPGSKESEKMLAESMRRLILGTKDAANVDESSEPCSHAASSVESGCARGALPTREEEQPESVIESSSSSSSGGCGPCMLRGGLAHSTLDCNTLSGKNSGNTPKQLAEGFDCSGCVKETEVNPTSSDRSLGCAAGVPSSRLEDGDESDICRQQTLATRRQGAESQRHPQQAKSSTNLATLEMKALCKYELFHKLPRGAASIDEVQQSSAGVQGWASWGEPEPREKMSSVALHYEFMKQQSHRYSPEDQIDLVLGELVDSFLLSCHLESQRHLPSAADLHARLSSVQRESILVWLVQACDIMRFHEAVLYSTVLILDRYCAASLEPLPMDRMQKVLMAVICTVLKTVAVADEICMPLRDLLVHLCRRQVMFEEILAMEHQVLNALRFQVSTPSALDFLDGLCVPLLAGESPEGSPIRCLANFLLQLSLFNAPLHYRRPHAILAAGAIYVAICSFQASGVWLCSLLNDVSTACPEIVDVCSEVVACAGELHAMWLSFASVPGTQVPCVLQKFAARRLHEAVLLNPMPNGLLTPAAIASSQPS